MWQEPLSSWGCGKMARPGLRLWARVAAGFVSSPAANLWHTEGSQRTPHQALWSLAQSRPQWAASFLGGTSPADILAQCSCQLGSASGAGESSAICLGLHALPSFQLEPQDHKLIIVLPCQSLFIPKQWFSWCIFTPLLCFCAVTQRSVLAGNGGRVLTVKQHIPLWGGDVHMGMYTHSDWESWKGCRSVWSVKGQRSNLLRAPVPNRAVMS